MNLSLKKTVDKVKTPVKRSVNLATIGVKTVNLKIAIPAVIIIVLAAAAFSKFGVADRLNAMSKAEGADAQARAELSAAYEKYDSFTDVDDKFAHYTYSGMTEEELNRADRVAVVELIDRAITRDENETSWTLSGNQLTVSVSGSTLQEISELVQELEKEPLVSYVTVTTAKMNETSASSAGTASQTGESQTTSASDAVIMPNTKVVANIVVYLQNITEDDE